MKKEQTPIYKWCDFNPDKIYDDPNHKDILNFYLWSCPSPETAYGAKTFEELGWEKPQQYKILVTYFISNNISFVSTTEKDIESELLKHNQLKNHSFSETIVFAETKRGKIDQVFRSIRNAIAHGSFCIEEKEGDDFFYFFESRNIRTKKIKSQKINARIEKINARIVLKSNTLVALINKVKNGPKGR